MVKNLPAMWKTWVQSLGWEDPLEKETATHSSILAWRVLWAEEPGRLQSMECTHIYTHTYIYYFHCTSFLYWGVHSQPGTFSLLINRPSLTFLIVEVTCWIILQFLVSERVFISLLSFFYDFHCCVSNSRLTYLFLYFFSPLKMLLHYFEAHL